jgi:hypothetical protein
MERLQYFDVHRQRRSCASVMIKNVRLFRRSGASKLLAGDTSFVAVNGSSDTTTLSSAWLNLFMAACKLLDLALVLPADFLPQFQL